MLNKWLTSRVPVFYVFCRFLFFVVFISFAKISSLNSLPLDDTMISKDMEKRLQEILSNKTRYFFDSMAFKDKYLNNLIQNLNDEIKIRKKEGFSFNESEFNLIFNIEKGVDNSLVKTYQQELSKIVGLIEDLNSLEKTSLEVGNNSSSQRINQLKSRLKSVLDVTDAGQSKVYSTALMSKLIQDYNKELDELIKIVHELKELKDKSKNLPGYQSRIQDLENAIANALNNDIQTTDPLSDSYLEELVKIVDILNQLDELDKKFPSEKKDIHDEIQMVKNRILNVVDRNTLASLGYKQTKPSAQPTYLTTYFDEWKARQILWFRAKQKQAELLKSSLISSGTEAQNRRMFEADVFQAVDEFNEGNFEVASNLFQDILQFYPYKKMEDFQYYLAECYLINKKYVNARELYSEIVKKGKDTEFVQKAYWRLMLISDSYKQYNEFFNYADKVIKSYKSSPTDDFLDKVVFYSGYMAYRIQNFERSTALLEKLSENSTYFISGQFLIAVNQINLNRPKKAKPILTFLGKESSYKEKNEISSTIRNLALLKTGLLYYNDGDLVNALQTLQMVDGEIPGYDIALLSRAWTWFRLGNLQNAANDLDVFFWDQLSSNYIYEAMMLSAHCNRLIGKVKSSVRKVRYVENAEKTVKINDELNFEKQKINELLMEIDAYEEQAVFSSDTYTYQKLTDLRHNLEMSLQSMAYRGDPGLQLIHEYEEEQQRMEELSEDFQNLNTIAEVLGDKNLKKDVRKALNKIESNLSDIQRFQNIKRVDVLADYPVARKESDLKFQKQKLARLQNEVRSEQQKLEFYKEEIASLMEEAEKTQNTDALSKLDYREIEMDELKDRLEVFMVNLSETDVKMLDTDFEKWSDFSGFGMSDLDFVRMKNIDKRIESYNENIVLINSSLQKKEKEILCELAVMDGTIVELEKSVYMKKIESIKAERERYFAEDYFVNRTSELELNPDQELEKLLEQQMKMSSDSTKVKKNNNQ